VKNINGNVYKFVILFRIYLSLPNMDRHSFAVHHQKKTFFSFFGMSFTKKKHFGTFLFLTKTFWNLVVE